MAGFEDFDRYCAENNVQPGDYGEAFRPLDRRADGGPLVPRFEKVKPAGEQILQDREQRDLDGVPTFLALRDDEDTSG